MCYYDEPTLSLVTRSQIWISITRPYQALQWLSSKLRRRQKTIHEIREKTLTGSGERSPPASLASIHYTNTVQLKNIAQRVPLAASGVVTMRIS